MFATGPLVALFGEITGQQERAADALRHVREFSRTREPRDCRYTQLGVSNHWGFAYETG